MLENPPNIQVLCTLSGDVMMYMKCFCETPVLNASGIMSIERRCYAIADIKKKVARVKRRNHDVLLLVLEQPSGLPSIPRWRLPDPLTSAERCSTRR